MNQAPCGHSEAKHTGFGNFWTCSLCDNKPVAKLSEGFLPVVDTWRLKSQPALPIAREYLGTWNSDEKQPSYSARFDERGIKLILSEELKRCADLIAPGVECTDDAYGSRCPFM